MTRQHSDFSASMAKRLLECPGSYRETKRLGATSKPTKYAAEGTAAHKTAEEWIHQLAKGKALKATAQNPPVVEKVDGYDIPITQEMVDFVEVYVNEVEGRRALGYEIMIEQRVSPSWLWNPNRPKIELYGFVDTVAYHRGLKKLSILDLKFGRTLVEIDWNAQFLYYGVGAIRDYPDAVEVETVVVQPRAYHPDGPVRRHVYTRSQVEDWGKNVLKPGVDLVTTGTAKLPFVPGYWCQFCPVQATCPELVRKAREAAALLFNQQPPAPTQQDCLDLIAVLEPWIESVRETAHATLEAGHQIPGYKLVDKRPHKNWINEKAIRQNTTPAQLGKITELKLLSPAQALKAAKTDPKLLAFLQTQITQVSSGTLVAPANDPRPAAHARPAAKDVFNVDTLDPLADGTTTNG